MLALQTLVPALLEQLRLLLLELLREEEPMNRLGILTTALAVQLAFIAACASTGSGQSTASDIPAPVETAESGAPEFERMNRVHCNTMEQLILLLPLMWWFAHVVNPTWAAGSVPDGEPTSQM